MSRVVTVVGYRLVGALLIGLCLLHTWDTVHAAPKAVLWERWVAHDQRSIDTIDHGLWDRFLSKHVKANPPDINRVTYAAVTRRDREDLERYLGVLAAVPISTYNRQVQLAYWVNFYNALTIQVVLDHYPISSISDIDISPGLFSVGPWKKN